MDGDSDFVRTRPPKKNHSDIEKILSNPGIYNKIEAERCRRFFTYFMKTFWECVSSDDLKWNWHLDYLCERLSEVAGNVANGVPSKGDLIINIPPGTTKSITCTVMFPVWCWVNWHWMRFIASSYSGSLALEHAETSRELVRSEKFQTLFPELQIKKDKDQKSNFRLQKTKKDGSTILGGNRYSTSVGGTLTGYHGHILLVDDPIDPNRSHSDVERKSSNRWIDQTLSTRKIDKAVTPTIIIMQRLHQDDPTGHIISKRENVSHICLPGEIDNYADKVQPPELKEQYVDGLLDPVRMPRNVLKNMKSELGQYGYSGQVGQDPVPPGGGMFKVDHIQTVDSMPPKPDILMSIRYWDKAGTQDGGKFTAGVLMHKLRGGRFLVSNVKRGQWGTDERERIIKEVAKADGPDVQVWIEQEPGSGGKESAESTIKNLAGYSAYKDRPTGDKSFRADPYSVQVNEGNVMILNGAWNKDYIEELRYFPFSTYSDQTDGSSGAFIKLTRKKQAGRVT